MKVFVTGHRGYIGTHLVDLLKQNGHYVTGCDLNLFDGCAWEPITKPDKELIKDIRQIGLSDIEGYDCIMHLAAISNDPMGDLDPELTFSVNRDGSVNLAKLARQAGVGRFLFSGSCSIYGQGEKLDLDENAVFNPVTAYAQSKIETEKAIGALADDSFSPVFLRNSTAYGHSPMLRIDLVVNNLLGCAVARGDIRIMSDGTPWRPLIHCRDIAAAFIAIMNAPKEAIHNKAINIGANAENYQVKDVGDRVQKFVPEAKIVYTNEVGADPRNYRVSFDLLGRLLPEFKLEYTLSSGMEELYKKFRQHSFNQADFDGDQFVRLRTLKKRLSLVQTQ
ncbi:MAG: SDR family oxidoreductase [Smithella sp.]|nr:SDR family oxidoreductase [Smithella sp.]